MTELLLGVVIVLLLIAIGLLVFTIRRQQQNSPTSLDHSFDVLGKSLERTERGVREEIDRSRQQFSSDARASRNEQTESMNRFSETLDKQLNALTQRTEDRLEKIRETVYTRLVDLQKENQKSIDQIRATVDEQLQDALQKRLTESFKLIGERLENVHRGLGEMQELASGVGDLKRMLTNVKTRGTWGEIQLDALLTQILATEQFETNVAVTGTSERVEFAIRLPGESNGSSDCVYLPIDAKFPIEDYQRLVDAHRRADPEAAEASAKQLETQIRHCAKTIRDKYLLPPKTTDFAILYLPIEGLYAEVAQRTGLIELLQREYRVVVAGPTTLAALLNSLQMGFRTLAIQERSSEVWRLLGTVKTEFEKYGSALAKVQKKLQEASNSIEQAETRTRVLTKKLRSVEEFSTDEPSALIDSMMTPDQNSNSEE